MSLLAMATGWAAGGLFYLLASPLLTGFRRATDVEAVLYWTAIFTFISWVVVVLPLIYLSHRSGRFLRLPWSPLFGAAAGLLVYLLLVGWWTGFWRYGLYNLHAAVIGTVSGLMFGLLTQDSGQPGL